MSIINEILAEIKKQNGNLDLDFANNEYHVFFKDAHVLLYLDQDTKTFEIQVEMVDENSAKVFFSERKLEDIM